MRHWFISLYRRWQQPWGQPQYDAFDLAVLAAEQARIQTQRGSRTHRHASVSTPRVRTKGGGTTWTRH
jgi:hypothetical protein